MRPAAALAALLALLAAPAAGDTSIWGAIVYGERDPYASDLSGVCYAGFGLYSCQYQTEDGTGGWQYDLPHNVNDMIDSFQVAPYCLGCCSRSRLRREIDEQWTLKCGVSDFTRGDTNLFGYEFRFLRYETSLDTTIISCELPRSTATFEGLYLTSYELTLEVEERQEGSDSWISVRNCTANATESAVPPTEIYEVIRMVGTTGPYEWSVTLYAVGGVLAFAMCFAAGCARSNRRCPCCSGKLVVVGPLCLICRALGGELPEMKVVAMMKERAKPLNKRSGAAVGVEQLQLSDAEIAALRIKHGIPLPEVLAALEPEEDEERGSGSDSDSDSFSDSDDEDELSSRPSSSSSKTSSRGGTAPTGDQVAPLPGEVPVVAGRPGSAASQASSQGSSQAGTLRAMRRARGGGGGDDAMQMSPMPGSGPRRLRPGSSSSSQGGRTPAESQGGRRLRPGSSSSSQGGRTPGESQGGRRLRRGESGDSAPGSAKQGGRKLRRGESGASSSPGSAKQGGRKLRSGDETPGSAKQGGRKLRRGESGASSSPADSQGGRKLRSGDETPGSAKQGGRKLRRGESGASSSPGSAKQGGRKLRSGDDTPGSAKQGGRKLRRGESGASSSPADSQGGRRLRRGESGDSAEQAGAQAPSRRAESPQEAQRKKPTGSKKK